ncbi:GntR family transcriptional regulator [Streptomyces sp. NPDC014676]|uniref:GntR family transcriptional regulator n=1 Tax=Streptomyces sp. NPDC014676 TaxID=3364879 RepID=UPI0036FF8C4D
MERVVTTVREGVKSGRYVPGQRLVEADLMQELGVGRNALREALSRLRSDGFVPTEAHRGASIRRLTREDVFRLHEPREVLEGLACRLAAERIDTADHRERLPAALASMHEVARTAELPAYMDENIRFHRAIVELGGHPRLEELVDQLQIQTFRVQFRSAAATHERAGMREYSVAEHQSLAEAILEGDGVRAEDLMRRHLRHTKSDVMRLPDDSFA